jgi:hypothetical protein
MASEREVVEGVCLEILVAARYRRVRRGLDRTAFAVDAEMGWPKGTSSAWESGSRTPDYGRLVQFCWRYGLSTESLFGLPGSQPRDDQVPSVLIV